MTSRSRLYDGLVDILKEATDMENLEEHFEFLDLWGPVIDRILNLGALMPEHDLLGLIRAHVEEMEMLGWKAPSLNRLKAVLG